jgi:hypothetical protein
MARWPRRSFSGSMNWVQVSEATLAVSASAARGVPALRTICLL